MDAPSLYERHLAKLRAEENLATWPLERFVDIARDELIAEGHQINDADPLHRLAILGRARDVRDCVAIQCDDINRAVTAKLKAKGGRHPNDVHLTYTLIAAFEHVGSLKDYDVKEEQRIAAAEWLGAPATKVTVGKALAQLPKLELAFRRIVEGNDPRISVRMLSDNISCYREHLLETEAEMLADARQKWANQKSDRYGGISVCGRSAR